MLRDQLEQVLRRPAPAAAMLVVGLFGGLLLGVLVLGRDAAPVRAEAGPTAAPTSAAPSTAATPQLADADADAADATVPRTAAAPDAGAVQERRDRTAVGQAIVAARSAVHDGDVDIAVMLDDWTRPESSGSAPFRAWSVSKVWSALFLRERGDPGLHDTAVVALTQSDNCMARRMTLRAQQDAGSWQVARGDLLEMLDKGGARADIPAVAQPADPGSCLEQLSEEERQAPALQLGTGTWSIGAAARFFHSIKVGVYGDQRALLALLSRPKRNSLEGADTLAAPDWGFGAAYGRRAAYKGGWGGKLVGGRPTSYVAQQVAIVPVGSGEHWAAVAVAYHPRAQPIDNDPANAGAPQAFEAILGQLKPALDRLG